MIQYNKNSGKLTYNSFRQNKYLTKHFPSAGNIILDFSDKNHSRDCHWKLLGA